MPVASLPNCRDFQKRFDLFLDGELDGRSMRSFALHVTRCPGCEEELRQSENLQEVLARAVESQVAGIDAADLWRSIERELGASKLTLAERFRERWQFRARPEPRTLALAASIALAVLYLSVFWSTPSDPEATRLANNKAQIDSLTSSASAVAVWTEPRQNTTAIWVASYEP